MVTKQITFNGYNLEKTGELNIYDGFDTKSELLDQINLLNISVENIVIIRFLGLYYAICFEDYSKEIMIGKEQLWFRQNFHMYASNIENFKLPYTINKLKTAKFYNTQVAIDLKNIDNNIEIYKMKNNSWYDISKFKYAETYLILLGITFYDVYFNKNEYNTYLSFKYFDTGYYYKIWEKHNDVESINPFKGLIKFKDGRIKKYIF